MLGQISINFEVIIMVIGNFQEISNLLLTKIPLINYGYCRPFCVPSIMIYSVELGFPYICDYFKYI